MNSKLNHYFICENDEHLYSFDYKNKLKKNVEPFGEINVIKNTINYFGVPIKLKRSKQRITFLENELFKSFLFTYPVYYMNARQKNKSLLNKYINEDINGVNMCKYDGNYTNRNHLNSQQDNNNINNINNSYYCDDSRDKHKINKYMNTSHLDLDINSFEDIEEEEEKKTHG